jgi:hypothetical protein
MQNGRIIAVDAFHDIKGGEEVICTTTKCPPGDVDIDHLVLAHGLGVNMNPEGVEVVVVELVAKSMFLGSHDMFLGHPSEGAVSMFIHFKHHGSIELAYDFLGVRVVEGHQRNKPKFFTNGLSFAKVLEI